MRKAEWERDTQSFTASRGHEARQLMDKAPISSPLLQVQSLNAVIMV